MRVSERRKSTPVGLSRFLVAHREHDGFETLRDRSLVTVVCSGCEASFSYLKPSEEHTPEDVDAALAQITGGGNGSGTAAPKAPERRAEPSAPDSPPQPSDQPPRRNGAGGAVSPAERLHEPHPFRTRRRSPQPATARRLAPPGPHAPRRRRNDPLPERAGYAARTAWDRGVAWAVPRRRTIALTALALAGAYVILALGLGDDASSSPGPAAPPPDAAIEPVAPTAESTSPPAVPDEGPMAEGARPLQSFDAGGPNVQEQTLGSFAVAMPPDWTREVTADGTTLLTPGDGGGSVLVRAQPRDGLTYGQMTDEAANYIAARVEPGTAVSRPTWKWVGNLLSVAVASEPDGHSEIAYIGVTPETRYLVVRSIEPHASALVRLQADGIVTSLTAQ
jgi:hypothetical protein